MNDKQLESFICIAECKSFGKAEKELFCSKQALTQRINSLEDELGFKLFQRDGKGVELTDIGLDFLSGAKKILAFQKMVVEQCKIKYDTPNKIRLAKSDYRTLLQEITLKYIRKYQSTQVDLVIGFNGYDECAMVLEDIIDIGETPYKPLCNNSELQYIKLIDSPYVCLMRKDHPLSYYKKLSWNQLKNAKTVFNPVQYSEERMTRISEELPQSLAISGLSHKMDRLYELMQEDMIFITPSYHVKKLPDLVCVPLSENWSREYGLVAKKEHSEAIEQYISLAKEIYELQSFTISSLSTK